MRKFFKFFAPIFFHRRTFYLDDIRVIIVKERNDVRLITSMENWLIRNQTLQETKSVLKKNFKIIREHYLEKGYALISRSDLNLVSLKIALRYFVMYNAWRYMYKREAKRDLTFIQDDFDHLETSHIIIGFFQQKYPDCYEDKCESLLGISNAELKHAVERKYQFDNK